MKSTPIDAGPLIALFDKSDIYHLPVKKFLKSYKGKLVTTLPVVTEVTHMLSFSVDTQIDFLTWIERGAIEIFDLNKSHLSRIIELSKKYSNVPMDFADASIIIYSEETGNKDIITIDSDYQIYRIKGKTYFNNILDSFLQNK